jgi:hypothetical protein
MNRKQKQQRAFDQRSPTIAHAAQRLLLSRGIYVPTAELLRLPFNDCVNAIGWVRNGRTPEVAPRWLVNLITSARAGLLCGFCTWCGVSSEVVVWSDERQIVCKRCAPQVDAPLWTSL